ncbi:unnamed protein product [Owenia fusiformis]|uniref:Uncharacterized protein n=1 Tax=Owenia fusiformis TaxID=6347 RepID=A0A8J1TBA2_OWEFU|nr:unnamed protein product [Owenia fusiformis]
MDIKEWCDDNGLGLEVYTALKDQGFESKVALLGMTDEDIGTLKLQKLGHVRGLEYALNELKTKAARPQQYTQGTFFRPKIETTEMADQDLTSKDLQRNKELNELAAKVAASGVGMDFLSAEVPGERTPGVNDTDKGKEPILLINDFVRDGKLGRYMHEDEQYITKDLVYKVNKKPKIENVTLPQWVSANAEIMIQMIKKGLITDLNDVVKYAQHTKAVGDLAQIYTIPSLMVYDNAFRIKQSEGAADWGIDDQHLVNFHLSKKLPSEFKKSGIEERKARQTQPQSQDNILCRQWNTLSGCSYGTQCKFAHGKCNVSGCSQAHPAYLHEQCK